MTNNKMTTRALIALVALAGQLYAADHKQPNIMFIMLDDMGYGDLRCYNPDSKIPTPNMDSLAESGMRFTDAHSPGALCVPSRFGFLTGLNPLKMRGYHKKKPIQKGEVTVASFLKEQGYSTAMAGKWHNRFWNCRPRRMQKVDGSISRGDFGAGGGRWLLDLSMKKFLVTSLVRES